MALDLTHKPFVPLLTDHRTKLELTDEEVLEEDDVALLKPSM